MATPAFYRIAEYGAEPEYYAADTPEAFERMLWSTERQLAPDSSVLRQRLYDYGTLAKVGRTEASAALHYEEFMAGGEKMAGTYLLGKKKEELLEPLDLF